MKVAAGKQHGGQYGTADGRWRIRGDVPVVDIGDESRPLDRLECGKIVHGQRAPAIANVCGNSLGQLALVEHRGAALGDRAETVRKVRDVNRAAAVVEPAVFVVQRGIAVSAAVEDQLAAVAEVVTTSCR